MDVLTVVLRAVHIGAGVFWAGTMIFLATMLGPSIADAGPAGGAVMAALLKRGVFIKIPIAAILTILSGLWLYDRVSGHFDASYMGSRVGMALGTGGLLAIIAFGFGMMVVRPAQMKIFAIMGMPDGPDKQARMPEVQALRAKAMAGGRIVAVLLMLTVLAMAVARYV